jgi:prepilin-type N-terminal cleavage/methylation domain-containing protein
MTTQHQHGFTLIELTVVVAILSALVVSLTMGMNVYYKRMQTQLVGKQYQLVNAAVGDYLGVHYQALSALPADCGQIALAKDTSLADADSISAGLCSLSLPIAGRTVTVANGMQPSLAELKDLRLLDRATNTSLMLPSLEVVATSVSGVASSTLAARSLAVQITKTCPTESCDAGVQLSSLVFNTQPYVFGGDNLRRFGFDLVDELLIAAGADAAFSHPVAEGVSSELHASQDLYVINNPIRDHGTTRSSALGLPGILAVRNGFGSSTLAQFARRDGTSKVTGRWDFDGNPIIGLSSLSASGVSSVTSSTNSLAVNGTAQVQSLQAQNISALKLKLPVAVADAECNPTLESMGLSSAQQLMVCDANKWTIYTLSHKETPP